jgi:3-isopropylmalate/(R)-2-methylmalate dehydratase large subunit
MAIEAGAKNGIFPVDERTRSWAASVAERYPVAKRAFKEYVPDTDAVYARTIAIDLAKVEPTISFPHLPSNAKTVSEAAGLKMDQVVIGSCTNGRIEDLRVAAAILGGRKVAKGLRCLVFPATQAIYLQALREGLVEKLVEAGAVVSTPTCGPCLGGHMGILAKGERALATTNRNFVGRMGHPESEVYLASPAVAAASAVTGRITDPSDILGAE